MQSWSTFNPRGIQLTCSKAALQCKPWCYRRFAELPLCSVLKHWCSQILSLFRLHTRNDMIEIFLWLYGFSLCSSPRELQGILSYLTLLGPHNCCAVCSNRQRTLYILNLVCPGNISSAFCCKLKPFLPWTLPTTTKMPVKAEGANSEQEQWREQGFIWAKCVPEAKHLLPGFKGISGQWVRRKNVSPLLVNTDVTIKLFC